MKKTKKIVIFNWRDPEDPLAGGAERVTLKHAQYWVKSGHVVTWVSGVFPGCSPEELKGNIRFIRSGSSKTLFLRAWWIFWTKLRGDADVIIDEIHGLPMFSPLWSDNIKVVAFIHELAQEIWSEMFPAPISWIGKWIERYLMPMVYKNTPFWVDCNSTKQDLMGIGIPSQHVHVIPCAIDPIPQIPAQKKEKDLTMIFVARLVKMKGIEYALQTFHQVLQEEPKAKLWIVGSGTDAYLNSLRELINALGIQKSVEMKGQVSEKQKYILLARAHFLIHTSIREGFGLTVLEANSQKTPAVVFDVSALRDLVDKTNGIIVPFADTTLLANRIVKLFNDKKRYEQIQKNAYTFYQQFRWSTFTKKSEELITI